MIRVNRKDDPFLNFVEEPSKEEDLNLEGYDAVIVGTTDSDMYQLLEYPQVMLDSSTSGKELITDRTPKAVCHIRPDCIQAYKAIVGDSSDNVTPLNLGIGPTDLVKFIEQNLIGSGELKEFITRIQRNVTQKTEKLEEFAKLVKEKDQVSNMIKNHKITSLEFVSTPIALHYEGYPYKEVLDKYGLKLR
jgi:5'-3' exonuclease